MVKTIKFPDSFDETGFGWVGDLTLLSSKTAKKLTKQVDEVLKIDSTFIQSDIAEIVNNLTKNDCTDLLAGGYSWIRKEVFQISNPSSLEFTIVPALNLLKIVKRSVYFDLYDYAVTKSLLDSSVSSQNLKLVTK